MEAKEYESVVREFQQYQVEYNAKAALSMFTPPETNKEKQTLAWLEGNDQNPKAPRLYAINVLWSKLNWFQIKAVKKANNGLVTIELLEAKTHYVAKDEPPYSGDTYYT
ncbi:hypothetical protein HY384_04330 [Candidatus Daviesbacteria bacterium]|nr:hypothetical protein [Candidatus Daviesbacteria bacterium]